MRVAGCRMTPLCVWLSTRPRAALCIRAPRACTASCIPAVSDFVALSVHAGVHAGTRVSVSVWLRVFRGEGGRGCLRVVDIRAKYKLCFFPS